MASETKLLGILDLDISTIQSKISQVNTELGKLGSNISLDLTNAANSAIQRLQQEIQNLNNLNWNTGGNNNNGGTPTGGNTGGSNAGGATQNQLRQTQQLLQDQYRAEAKFWTASGQNAQTYYSNLNASASQQVELIRKQNAGLVDQAENTLAVQKAMRSAEEAEVKFADRIAKQQEQQKAKADAAQEKRENDQLARELAAIEKEENARINAQKQTQARLEQAWEDHDRAAKEMDLRETFDYYDKQAKAWEDYDKAFEQAQDSWYDSAVENKQQQIALQQQMDQLGDNAVNQRAELQKELEGLQTEYAKYGKDIQDQVEQDQRVLDAYDKQAIAAARIDAERADAKRAEQMTRLQQGVDRTIMIAGRASINLITNLARNAWDFAMQFDDYMNAIQRVTLKSDDEMKAVRDMIRETARDLGLTSTEVASSAELFYRMGFNNEEVQERISWVSKFAKIANVDFADAAKMVVTISNSMADSVRGDIQRVVDVLLYLGDNSATTAGEVATAMQSLGPVANAVGISYERIASMTAALSDKTQQSATRIATGLRTVIMRLFSVRNTQIEVFKDFTDEGEMAELWEIANDPSKLMAQFGELGIELQDAKGQWRDFYDIMLDVANLWATLNEQDPRRSAIMTILGGLRGGTYVAALLDSLAADDGKVKSLYSGAVEAYGSTNEKYAIWMDSAAAAQERYDAALQEMYSILDVSVVISFYEAMANVAHYTALSTQTLSGFNLIIPALIAGFLSIRAAVAATGAASLTFANVMNVIKLSMEKHPLMWAATIFVTLATAISVASGAIINAVENVRKAQIQQYNDAIDLANKAQRKAQTFIDLRNEMNAMFESSSDVTGEMEKYNSTLEALAQVSPVAAYVVEQLRNGLIDQAEAARILNEELNKTIATQQKISATEYQKALGIKTTSDSIRGLNAYDSVFDQRAQYYIDYLNNMGPEQWAESLRQLYSNWNSYNMGYTTKPADDATYDLGRAVGAYMRENVDATWDMAAAYIWDILHSSSFVGDEYQDTLDRELKSWLDDAVGSAGISNLPSFIQDAFIEEFKGIIVGENGVADKEDFMDEAALRDALLRRAKEIWGSTWDKNTVEEIVSTGLLSSDAIMDAILSQIFGSDYDPSNAWDLPDEDVAYIANGYEQLLQAGFQAADIKGTFRENGMLWDLFDGFDEQQMKSVKTLVQDLGWTLSDFYDILSNPEAADSFKQFLGDTDQEFSRLTRYTDLDTLLATFANLSAIVDTLDSDGALTVEDLTNMQKTPWLLSKVGSEDLRDAIQETLNNIDVLLEEYFKTQAQEEYDSLVAAGKSPLKPFQSKVSWINEEAELLQKKAERNNDSYIEYLAAVEDDHITYTPIDVDTTNAATGALADAQAQIDAVTASLNEAVTATGEFDSEFAKLKSDISQDQEAIDAGIAEMYKQYELLYPELKNYVQGSSEYMQRLSDLLNGATQGIIEETDAFKELNQTVEDGNKSGSLQRPSLDLSKGILASGTMSDVSMGGSRTEEKTAEANIAGGALPEIQEYIETALTLIAYSSAISEAMQDSAVKTSDYFAEINDLATAFAEGGIYSTILAWSKLDDTVKSAIADTFPMLIKTMGDVAFTFADNTDATNDLGKALSSAVFRNNAKYFSNTAKSIDKLTMKTTTAADAYGIFYGEAQKAVAAQSEFLTATDKLADGSQLASDDVKNLAEYLGFITPDALLKNWDQVGPMLMGMIDEITESLHRLNEAAFIQITGTSVADFSALTEGLLSTKGLAEEVINLLIQTGQWTLETVDLPQEGAWFDPISKSWIKSWLTTGQTVLRYSPTNPLSGSKSSYASGGSSSGGGGGGGGGGGSSSKGMTEVERMLDRMAQIQDIQDHVRSLYSAQAKLYEQTGQLQGAIKYYEKERTAIEQQNKTLQANIDEMEPWLEKKRAEVAALDVASAEYEEASSDLKALQERHQQYTLALINNTAEIDQLTEAIKEQHNAIRKMEIDLRNTILDAIKDREALNERMLEGTIKVEEEILELIKRRYEKERDMILENTEKQISALEKERDLLSEQLELRKQQAEEEDKAAKLAELEAKYARIVADPTRQKEALSIQKEIRDLRDEMSWDLAEKEVKAQQDSIDQQIDSLNDYKEYTENYYEYLFAHPKKLIEEMKEIMKGADDEIIAWLIANDEEYAEATEATKKQTEDSWREMLRDMRGELELFWDEVEEIIAGGDDYIINFLKENSAAYREAGQLQAEAYVDEWKKQLEDLRKAYEEVADGIEPYDYEPYIAPAEGNGSGGGGGGGGGGSTSANTKTTGLLSISDITGMSLENGNGPISKVQEWAEGKNAFYNLSTGDTIKKNATTATTGNSHLDAQINKELKKLTLPLVKFGTGGVAGSDGLAWVDDKERILTPYQTELFESLMSSLDSMSRRVSVPGMPLIGDVQDVSGSPMSFGDIIVNVETLDGDADYEELAQKVLDAVTEKMNRGSVVGGIRYAR